jgi:hypothetical protein
MNSALIRSACVCSGKRRPSSSRAGSSGFRPAAMPSDSPGLILITSAVSFRRAAISRYSALAGSTTSQGICARVAASSRARIVCDLPEPVAPVTKTCLFSESFGSTSGPAARLVRSSTSPSAIASRVPADSCVTSNSGLSASLMPGISLSGGRASAASRSVLARNSSFSCSISSLSGSAVAAAGASVYGSSVRSVAAHTSPATRAAAAGSAPPTKIRTRQKPVDNPLRISV